MARDDPRRAPARRSLLPLLHRGLRPAGLALLLVLALANCVRSPVPPQDFRMDLRFVPLALPDGRDLAASLGPFRLERAWRMESRHSWFGGWSALVPDGKGGFVALSDGGFRLAFRPPGRPPVAPTLEKIWGKSDPAAKLANDAEAATRDPRTGTLWIAWEQRNTITRHDAGFTRNEGIWPRAMRGWGGNAGPEAMARLADGRFLVLREGTGHWRESRRRPALLFPADPVDGAVPIRFSFTGPEQFSPVDAAPLPDGRVLVLLRRAVWPMPFRFAGRIAIADPADIRAGGEWRAQEVARLTSSLGVDNFEGMAVEPRADGRVGVWLVSDDNHAVSQRTLLWQLSVDPADLPRTSKRAQRNPPRP